MKNLHQHTDNTASTGISSYLGADGITAICTAPDSPFKTALDTNVYAVELIETLLDHPDLSRADVEDSLKCIRKSAQTINILFARATNIL